MNELRQNATLLAIKKIAYYTARSAKGQRRKDAIEHCRELGVNYEAPTFAEGLNP